MKTEPIHFDGFEPTAIETDLDGLQWLHADYSHSNIEPYNWPKHVMFDGLLFKYTGFNSDRLRVYYKQTQAPNIAIPC